MIIERENGHWFVAVSSPRYRRLTGPLDWKQAIRYAVNHSANESIIGIQNGLNSLEWDTPDHAPFQPKTRG